ncbi:MAG: hypothetical protein GKR93_18455 [Gammaproteobacteria bacterium]|nr:hypothetical protein [Gammaproteobacteria bacterium]
MTDHSGKIFPRPSPETAVYWDACREHKLMIQQCHSCNHFQFYPRIMCTQCMSSEVNWVQASGKAEVLSFTIVRHPVSKAYAEETPYVVALIQLSEGPTLMSNVIECDLETVAIGMPVEVVFENWSEEISIPKFKPAE